MRPIGRLRGLADRGGLVVPPLARARRCRATTSRRADAPRPPRPPRPMYLFGPRRRCMREHEGQRPAAYEAEWCASERQLYKLCREERAGADEQEEQ